MPVTKPIEREAPVSDPMKKAFAKLETIKIAGGRQIDNVYIKASAQLEIILNDAMKRGQITKADKALIKAWSKQAAKERNSVIFNTLSASYETANTYLAEEMTIAAWGSVDESVRREFTASLMRDVRERLAVKPTKAEIAAGRNFGAVSKAWWTNGFSRKDNERRLINAIARNIALGKDAAKAGKQLVLDGLISIKGDTPSYLQDIIDLAHDARLGGLNNFAAEFDKAKRRVKKLRGQIMATPTGQRAELLTRPQKNKLLREIKAFAVGGSKAQFDASMKAYALNQATYNAKVLQRSATNDVFQTRVRTWAEDNPRLVKFVAWQLAPVRNFRDICDDYAQVKWQPGEVPAYPHYNCACTTQVILISSREHALLALSGSL